MNSSPNSWSVESESLEVSECGPLTLIPATRLPRIEPTLPERELSAPPLVRAVIEGPETPRAGDRCNECSDALSELSFATSPVAGSSALLTSASSSSEAGRMLTDPVRS